MSTGGPRTTRTLMEGITDIRKNDDVDPFIATANDLVNECCAIATDVDGITPFYTELQLTDIETWLACHFYHIYRPWKRGVSAGTVRADYESKVDLGLAQTRYGQQAMVLDRFGGLAAQDALVRSSAPPPFKYSTMLWLGSTELEEIGYYPWW